MANTPTPEESGKKILEIYKSHDTRPGEMLQVQMLTSNWFKEGGRADDFEAGLAWLFNQKYVERQEGKSTEAIFLTEAGFAAI